MGERHAPGQCYSRKLDFASAQKTSTVGDFRRPVDVLLHGQLDRASLCPGKRQVT
jgi:hypothetical protein